VSGRYGRLSSPGTQTLRLWQSSRRGLAKLPGGAAALVAELLVIAAAGVCRAGWYSRRVRASAERGRVQGPGRAEADLDPRTITATDNFCLPNA
jgi:hypothetical protein